MVCFFSCISSPFCGVRRRLRHRGVKKYQTSNEGTVTRVYDSVSPISIASPSPVQKSFCSFHQKFSSSVPPQKPWVPVLSSVASSAYSTCYGGQNFRSVIECSEVGDRSSETHMLINMPANGTGEPQLSASLQVTLSSQHKPNSERIASPSALEYSLASGTVQRLDAAEISAAATEEFHAQQQTRVVDFLYSNSQLQQPRLSPNGGKEAAPLGFIGGEDNKTAWCKRKRSSTVPRQTIPKVRDRRMPCKKEMMRSTPGTPLHENSSRFLVSGDQRTTAGTENITPHLRNTPVQRLPPIPLDAAKATFCLDRFCFGGERRKGRHNKAARLVTHMADVEADEKEETTRSLLSEREIDGELFNLGEGMQVGDEDLLFLSDMTSYIDCHFADG
ncbi:hypothetical protein TGRUB_206660 [Toxoplasma gondii RUB]|uniref:Uncharacterized protein n=1 Tax=Toxoplasma gondii RUB TaxID=935652 RepID=A0A086LQY4_TOXGO|nr:hypothetical protein TGRUB_206660 [Toxoplasma gondii RUB]